MVKVNRLYNRIEPISVLFWALGRHCIRAYTAIGDPAHQPGIPQPWYWHGTVRQGSVRFNLSEEVTPSFPSRCTYSLLKLNLTDPYRTVLLGGPRPALPIKRIKHPIISKSNVKVDFSLLC